MVDESVKRKVGWALQELNSLYAPTTIDIRAENAFGVAIRFFELINQMIPEPKEKQRLMMVWFKSVKDRDFRKFRRALRKYDRLKNTQETIT
jgi:ADP-heptose:LPS heptosyltransferase